MRETALDGMEECPAYFGAFPPPETTPYGHIVRYKVLMNGVFWIQTDAPATALAVAYPIQRLFGVRHASCGGRRGGLGLSVLP